ncbi:NUDIX hydrolase [Williamsia sterculiae]|uniref:Isopentenyldiphosphate isomerase n=1 Tax=Williamsia sterculiae TaxID=1344003 RepID=A0A1N7EMH2_9NOCA|nr:NUDIX domain-containing protein [Williamsia sterculiae]SIR89287.1 Isopentenyldiphosphate isomerase [Williamsia sterculiae]
MPEPASSRAGAEQVAVYDAGGRVTGTADRATVYADGLWHASAGVLIRSTDRRRLYVHRRTRQKAVFGGLIDCLAGGVIDPGESVETAARRELAEELGVTVDGVMTPLTSGRWEGRSGDATIRCHLTAFVVDHDGPFRWQASEIADAWWWSAAELAAAIADSGSDFVPDTRAMLRDVQWDQVASG